MIASKPDVTSSEVRKFYRPYDFRPEAMKNTLMLVLLSTMSYKLAF